MWRHLNYSCSVFCFFSLDQTPTPTRFLKNCEEVGLFNELASSFEQDEDDKRAKNSVRTLTVLCNSYYVLNKGKSVVIVHTSANQEYQSIVSCLCLSYQIPASNSVALDMSLQTPSDVKVKKEAPVEVDSSPDSPESISGKSDHSREALVKAKVEKWEEGGLHACGIRNDEKNKCLARDTCHYAPRK